jgi:hypothetical protein
MILEQHAYLVARLKRTINNNLVFDVYSNSFAIVWIDVLLKRQDVVSNPD